MSIIMRRAAWGSLAGALFVVTAVGAGLFAGRAGAQAGAGADVNVNVGVRAAATTTAPRGEVRRAAVREFQVKFETARKDAAERVKTARTEFQTKLKQIRDEKKKQAADNLFGRLGSLNEKWTAHFADLLGTYDAALKKVESRRDKAQARLAEATGDAQAAGNPAVAGVTAVNAALQAANTAITAARAAVEAQAKKTYSVTVTTDARLRAAFQTAHTALKKDLMDLRDGAMKSVREAVQKAIQALRSIPAVDDDSALPRATSTNATSS